MLTTIHTSYTHIPFSTGVILQLHRDLYQFAVNTGGRWKTVDNEISATYPDGTKVVRFRPFPAYATPVAMERLQERFNRLWELGRDRTFIADSNLYFRFFLCIHPFLDGNGRMARLLTLLLLYKAGYEVGRFISLERIVERTKESYYDTLSQSSQGWHEGQHNLLPWWEYFLGVMLLSAYGSLNSGWDMLHPQKELKRQSYWMRLTICLKNSLLGNCRNGVRQWELI